MVLRCVVINSPGLPSSYLRYLCEGCGSLSVIREIPTLPAPHELTRYLAVEPDLVLLGMGGESSHSVAAQIRAYSRRVLIIAAATPHSRPTLDAHATLPPESTAENLDSAIREAVSVQLRAFKQTVVCFLPTKAGSGSSTVVLNTAAALVRDYGQRVLVIDGDLRSSVLSTMAGCTPESGIEFLFEALPDLNADGIQRFMVGWNGVDLLLATRSVQTQPPTGSHYLRLLLLLLGSYDVVLIDLPELINPATIDAARLARFVFAVCTPELPALTLAKQRLAELDLVQIPDEKVGVIVNRWHRTDPPADALAELLGQNAVHIFPNDYPSVSDAIRDAGPVQAKSRLAESYAQFASGFVTAVQEEPKSIRETVRSLFTRKG